MLIPLTITATHSVTLDPIEGVEVALWDSTYSTYFDGGATDVDGEFVTGLEPGTYKAFLLKSGFTFYSLPKTIGLDTDPLDISFKGIPVEDPALPAGYTYLYGTLKNLDLNPGIMPVFIHLQNTPQTKDGAVLGRSTMTVCPDETGYWGVLLAGGIQVTVSIPSCKYQKTGLLPFAGKMEVNELGVYG